MSRPKEKATPSSPARSKADFLACLQIWREIYESPERFDLPTQFSHRLEQTFDNPDKIDLSRLCILCLTRKDFGLAMEISEAMITHEMDIYGQLSSQTARHAWALKARVLTALGQFRDTEPMLRHALLNLKPDFGFEDWLPLFEYHMAQGQCDEARNLYEAIAVLTGHRPELEGIDFGSPFLQEIPSPSLAEIHDKWIAPFWDPQTLTLDQLECFIQVSERIGSVAWADRTREASEELRRRKAHLDKLKNTAKFSHSSKFTNTLVAMDRLASEIHSAVNSHDEDKVLSLVESLREIPAQLKEAAQLGGRRGALVHAETVLSFPKETYVADALAESARTLSEHGHASEALEVIEMAMQMPHPSADCFHTFLSLCLKYQQPQVSHPYLPRLSPLMNEHPELLVPAATIWLQLGERAKALRLLNQAEVRGVDLSDLRLSSEFLDVKGDPRFALLINKNSPLKTDITAVLRASDFKRIWDESLCAMWPIPMEDRFRATAQKLEYKHAKNLSLPAIVRRLLNEGDVELAAEVAEKALRNDLRRFRTLPERSACIWWSITALALIRQGRPQDAQTALRETILHWVGDLTFEDIEPLIEYELVRNDKRAASATWHLAQSLLNENFRQPRPNWLTDDTPDKLHQLASNLILDKIEHRWTPSEFPSHCLRTVRNLANHFNNDAWMSYGNQANTELETRAKLFEEFESAAADERISQLQDLYARIKTLPQDMDRTKSLERAALWLSDNAPELACEIIQEILEDPNASPNALDLAIGLFCKTKQLDRGMAAADRALAYAPWFPSIYRNAARICALSGEAAEALAHIASAKRYGYDKFEAMRDDPDLASLKTNPKFQAFFQPKAA